VPDNNSVQSILPLFDSSLILKSVAILILAYAIGKLFTYVHSLLSEHPSLNKIGVNRITIKMLLPLLKFSIYFIAIYFIFASILKVESQQLILFSGLLGVVLGFGVKDLFADVVGGIIIVLDRPYQVGDKVDIGGFYGEVKDIGLRDTRLFTPDDTSVSIPNSSVFQKPISNVNAGSLEMMVVIDLFIDPESDISLAMQILKEALVTSKYVHISEKHKFVVLSKDFPFYKRIRAKAYTNDFRHEFLFETDVTRRSWDALMKAGIKPPKISLLDNMSPSFSHANDNI
jgi:moderate conductance mechanosensitive channel